MRKVGEDMKLPVSISIGIGVGGSLSENDMYARNALDMALGRGGDQVSIKDDTQYKFYGSKARDYEKSTRVKTRAIAVALKDFIKNSDKTKPVITKRVKILAKLAESSQNARQKAVYCL